jgi:WD40 repeat protein
MSKSTCAVLFKEHNDQITNIRFAFDGRLFMSSLDKSASIATLDDRFLIVSSIKLEGHAAWVTDILPLPASNQCVTCSGDETIKVWDCQTGACLRTLTEHNGAVASLAIHPHGQYFASGSFDKKVVIWSSTTFEVLRRIAIPNRIGALAIDESDILYAGVYDHGVMSCNALTGEVGSVVIPGAGLILGHLLSKSTLCHPLNTSHSHS